MNLFKKKKEFKKAYFKCMFEKFLLHLTGLITLDFRLYRLFNISYSVNIFTMLSR